MRASMARRIRIRPGRISRSSRRSIPARRAACRQAFRRLHRIAPEASYAWFGNGYAGSSDPNNANFSWPAFWGNRNSNNDTANATVSAVYPAPGNPAAYSNPQWPVAGTWDPNVQIIAAMVPEPGAAIVGVGAIGLASVWRRARSENVLGARRPPAIGRGLSVRFQY